MENADWFKFNNFAKNEFECPCCGREEMDREFLKKLQNARIIADVGFPINSGFRCPAHNKKVGGEENSSHLRGHAADIKVRSSRARHQILQALFLLGFNRIGIYPTFIHVDNDPDLPVSVVWVKKD